MKSLNVTNLGVVLKRFGLVLLYCPGIQNTAKVMALQRGAGGAGGQKVFAERS